MSSRQRGGADKGTVKSIIEIGSGVLSLSGLIVRPKLSLAAENLFLRKQLAFYEERGVLVSRRRESVMLYER
jgi:hypothetical protein